MSAHKVQWMIGSIDNKECHLPSAVCQEHCNNEYDIYVQNGIGGTNTNAEGCTFKFIDHSIWYVTV